MRAGTLAALAVVLGTTDLTREIARIADGARSPGALWLRLDWLREGRMTSAEVYGRGVGIWDARTQVSLSREEVLALVRALRDAGFGSMPGEFGEMEPEEVVRIRGKLAVRVDGRTKTVLQLLDGPRSPQLESLATRILQLAEAGARGGVSATGLGDALAKLAAGTLAPEAFQLTVQRRPETSDPKDAAEEGFLLRVSGREVTARSFRQEGGYGPPRRLTLSAGELASLVETLKAAAPESLPRSLWAPQYTELRLSVLGQVADLSARRALGLTAETHGEKQKAFDRMFAAARALARRVAESGTEDVGSPGREGRPDPGGLPLGRVSRGVTRGSP